MKRGTQVVLVEINPKWPTAPVRLSAKAKVGCKTPKVGTKGTVVGVQQGTGLILVKFAGRSWPLVCDPHNIAEQSE